MLGKHHFSLSVATYLAVFAPLILVRPWLFCLFGFGVSVGSLLPDVDGEDATIFHQTFKGMQGWLGGALGFVVRPLSVFFPYIGYLVKYVVYRPTVWLYDFLLTHDMTTGHRGYTHSHLGIWTTSTVIAALISLVSSSMGAFTASSVVTTYCGLVFGMYLHIVQDSCTKSGIVWNFPFSNKALRGDRRTGPKASETPIQAFLCFLVIFAGISLGVVLYHDPPVFAAIGANMLTVSIPWIGFLWGVHNARLT